MTPVKPDRPDHRERPAECTPSFVARNIRGVMLAAFLPTETLARIFGCSEEDAFRFSCGARDDIGMVRTAIAQAKGRMGPRA